MADSDDEKGRNPGWRLIDSHTRFENELMKLREDEVALPEGSRTRYAYLDRAPAVIIVPVTRDGEVVLVKQYRYPVDEWCLEVPAGGTSDTGDASLEEVARKELREEIGGSAEKLTEVGFFYSANSLSNEKCHVFLAEGVEIESRQKTEATEEIEIERVSAERAMELAKSGAMKTGPCALAILMCEPLLGKVRQLQRRPDHLLET